MITITIFFFGVFFCGWGGQIPAATAVFVKIFQRNTTVLLDAPPSPRAGLPIVGTHPPSGLAKLRKKKSRSVDFSRLQQ